MPAIRYWARQYWPDLATTATTNDPKEGLEAELFTLLDAELAWPVYNTTATGSSFAYVVFQAMNGDDDHMKKRGHTYEYQVVGIHTDRLTALGMSAATRTLYVPMPLVRACCAAASAWPAGSACATEPARAP